MRVVEGARMGLRECSYHERRFGCVQPGEREPGHVSGCNEGKHVQEANFMWGAGIEPVIPIETPQLCTPSSEDYFSL